MARVPLVQDDSPRGVTADQAVGVEVEADHEQHLADWSPGAGQ